MIDGETGFVVNNKRAMVEAVERLDEIDPARCRSSTEERFDVAPVAEAYEAAYTTSGAPGDAHPFVDVTRKEG